MKILKETEKVLEFELECPLSVANALRRHILGRLPVYGIDCMVFYENNSTYFDEFISHRIGQVPLKTPVKTGADSKDVTLSLNVSDRNIYSRDIKGEDDIKVANGDIPLVKLTENQSVRAECHARVGYGMQHARFQPGLASYQQLSEGKFRFYVESFGQMKAKDMVLKATEIIESGLDAIEKAVG